MKIMKTLVGIAEEPHIVTADTVEHEGKLWIIPLWFGSPEVRYRWPARIIRIDSLPHTRTQTSPDGRRLPADFVLTYPVPRAVLEGRTSDGYEVVEQPDIKRFEPQFLN